MDRNSIRKSIRLATFVAGGTMLLSATVVLGTAGSGVTNVSTRGDGNINGKQKVNSGGIKFEAKDGMRVFDQELTLLPAGQVGWHSHPGPVLVTVKTGTFRYQEADCTYTDFAAGESFIDEGGGHIHNGRNLGTVAADLSVTYLLPLGTAPRIDVAESELPAFTRANCL